MWKPFPKCVSDAAQGLAFWSGYHATLQSCKDLSEGALENQFCEMLCSHVENGCKPRNQFGYANLVKGIGKDRMDIFIPGNDTDAGLAIEIKKYKGLPSVKADCLKLSRLLIKEKIRCFVVVASQGKRPTKFTTPEGKANREFIFSEKGWCAKVRRVLKASASFDKKNRAHYVCVIEVLKRP
jgi:hypothetical protein